MTQTATLIAKKLIAEEVYDLVFHVPQPFTFAPGQYITILVPTLDGKKLGRSYSIASLPGDNRFTLIIKLVPNGLASGYVEKMQAGEVISFVGPIGRFVLSQLPLDFVFVATGTGLAPFIPMIATVLAKQPERKVALLLGFRHEEDMFYHDEIHTWQKDYAAFEPVLALTKPLQTWSGYTGRVTAYLSEHPEFLQNKQLYICGNGSMITDVQTIAVSQGLPKEQIFFEKYNNL